MYAEVYFHFRGFFIFRCPFKTRIACRESYRWTESTETFRLHETSHVDRLFSVPVPTRQCWFSFFQSNLFLIMWQLFDYNKSRIFFPALCKMKTLLPSGLWGFVGSNECHRIRRGSVEDCLNIYLYLVEFLQSLLLSHLLLACQSKRNDVT